MKKEVQGLEYTRDGGRFKHNASPLFSAGRTPGLSASDAGSLYFHMSLKRIANRAKDATMGLIAARKVNEHYLKKLGHMTKLQIDSEKKEIFMSLDLRGEQTPIELTVNYLVVSPTEVEITNVQASREWIATLAKEMGYAQEKRITVPEIVTTALSKLIQ